MEPAFNQALKAGHDGFVTDTYIYNWCMQQKVLLLNVNNIGRDLQSYTV